MHRSKAAAARSWAPAALISSLLLLIFFFAARQYQYTLPYRLFWSRFDEPAAESEGLVRLAKATAYLEEVKYFDANSTGARAAKLLPPPALAFNDPYAFKSPPTLEEQWLLHGPTIGQQPPFKLAVIIPSSPRRVQYIHRTLASLLLAAAHEKALPIHAAVLDLSEAGSLAGRDYAVRIAHENLHVVSRQQMLRVAPNTLRAFHQSLHHVSTSDHSSSSYAFQRQRLDYALALGYCLQTRAQYCLVLEDDAIMSQSALAQLVHVTLPYLESQHPHWGLLRLFGTDHFAGWERTWWDVLTLAGLGAVGATAGMFAASSGKASSSLVVLGFALGVLVPVLVGKQYMPWNLAAVSIGRYGAIVVPAQEQGSVSSLAHVYPRHVAAFLIDRLCVFPPESRLPVDLYVGDVLHEHSVDFFEAVPNLVEHVGRVSSFDRSAGAAQVMINSRSFAAESTPF